MVRPSASDFRGSRGKPTEAARRRAADGGLTKNGAKSAARRFQEFFIGLLDVRRLYFDAPALRS
jgi:hypothetical protein